MPKGFLSLFDDPVVGPQLALGLLNSGVGLLTSRPEDLSRNLQPGLGQISQGLFYGGRQKSKKAAEEQLLASRKASAEEFAQRFLSGAQGGPRASLAPPSAPAGPSYTPGMGMPPFAPMQSQGPPPPMAAPTAPGPGAGPGMGGRIAPEAGQLMQFLIEHPENARAFGPAITQLLQPKKLSRLEEYNQFADLAFATPEERALGAKREIGLVTTAGQDATREALARYNQQKEVRATQSMMLADEDRNRGLDIQAAAQKATADNYANRLDLLKGGGAAKVSAFKQKMADLNFAPGSPEYEKAGRIAAGLEPRASNATPIFNDKGEITGYIGGGPKPLTEQQGKNVVNATAAQQAQDTLASVRESGFDPASMRGAAEVSMADVPIISGIVSKEAQMQAGANRQIGAALNYARSGSNITALELENTKKSLEDRQGDKPETTEWRRAARQALIDSMQASDPVRIGNLVKQYSNGPPGGKKKQGQSRSEQGAISAAQPSRDDIEAEMRRRGLIK